MEILDSGLTTTLVLVVTFVGLWLYRHFTKLRRCGIPGPTPWPFFGTSLQQINMGDMTAEKEWTRKFGKVYGSYQGFRTIVTVTDKEMLKSILVKDFANFTDRVNFGNIPDLLRNGLVFMRGQRWKRTRNILTPTFSAGKLKYMISILNHCASVMIGNLSKHTDQTVTAKNFFSQFTLDAIASTAFSLDIESQTKSDSPFIKNLNAIFGGSSKVFSIIAVLNGMVPGIGRLLYKLGVTNLSKKGVRFYEDFGKSLIADRRSNKAEKKQVDFMQLLIDAEINESKLEYVHNGVTMETTPKVQKEDFSGLTDEEINGQTFIFFLAGMETTATLLNFAVYRLALQPDIDEKLVEEISKHIGMEDPTYETVNKLKYMDQFVNEVLRFYPPAPRLNRETKEDRQYGKIVIPKGTMVSVPVWQIHHSDDYYPDAEKFDPERFSSTNKSASDPVTFLPFGFGPRHCIGMRLALVEAKVALVYLLRKLRFVKSDKTQVPLELDILPLLRPKKPIQLCVLSRSSVQQQDT